jgi:Zn-dependent M28 family amino/carboxypeptidase
VGRRAFVLFALLAGTLVALAAAPLSSTAPGTDSTALRNAVTVNGVMAHERAFQKIADQNEVDGVPTRASGTPGYNASVNYVVGKLTGAGYNVTVQPFDFNFFRETGPSSFERLSPTSRVYVRDTDYSVMEYSGSGTVTGNVVPTNDVIIPPSATPSSTSGCEASDFPAATSGNIALIQRGTCTFEEKANNAQAAGAIGVIIFNEGQPGRTGIIIGTLGNPETIPVLDTTFAVGEELYSLAQAGTVSVRISTQTVSETRATSNVIANTKTGRTDRAVVVGAHLDSVVEGPGINDNGSGTSAILEIALQMAKLKIQPTNQVRFAFWGAEESGLIGSEFYVNGLTKKQQQDIALNLNFDMVGSPNFVRFVYDGDGSDTPVKGPTGSANIERVFLDYFASQGLPTEPTAFDGRSDYGPFIAVGIPAGGLFTGAEGIKTAEEAAIYGGTAGIAYDPCYHQLCDRITNVNTTAIDQMSDAIADATLAFAMTSSAVSGTERSSVKTEFSGPKAHK